MKTIVFVHGMFLTSKSWMHWISYFEKKGYQCHAPAWPYHGGEPSDLRKNISSELCQLELSGVVDSYTQFIQSLKEKPIVIGHSMGGLVTQILVNRGLASHGICINSAAPNGMLSFQWSFLKTNIPVINPLKGNAPVLLSVADFKYAFCNTMADAEAQRTYDNFVVPESRNVPRSSSRSQGRVDLKKPHAPLFFISGERDHIIPASLNVKNFKSYKDPKSSRTYKVFAGRGHSICVEKGWEEVADSCWHWLQSKESLR